MSADYPPLKLESWQSQRRGGPSGQVTVDRVERLSRVLGHDCEVEFGAWCDLHCQGGKQPCKQAKRVLQALQGGWGVIQTEFSRFQA